MKRNFLRSALMAGVLLSFAACDEDDNSDKESIIEYSALPEGCRTMIEEHFNGATAIRVAKNNVAETDGTLYEVRLSNNFEIDLDGNCDWTDIDGNQTPVPDALVPAGILSYTQANYPPPLFIEGIDKEPYGYQVEISNDVDLKFDADGTFIAIDN